MSEKSERKRVQYPTTLDVIRRGDKEYQIIGMVQTGKPDEDIYLLKDPQSGQIQRVKGARFVPTSATEPGTGTIHKREEGVRVTGDLPGGSEQD